MSGEFPNSFVSNGLDRSVGSMGTVHSLQYPQEGIFLFDGVFVSQAYQQQSAAFGSGGGGGGGCCAAAIISPIVLPLHYEASLFKLIERNALLFSAAQSALLLRHMAESGGGGGGEGEGGEFANTPFHHQTVPPSSDEQSSFFNPYAYTYTPNLNYYGYSGLNMMLLDEERRLLMHLLFMAARNLLSASEANHLNGQLVAHIIANSFGVYSAINSNPTQIHVTEQQQTDLGNSTQPPRPPPPPPPGLFTQPAEFGSYSQACCDTSPPQYIQRKEQVEEQEQRWRQLQPKQLFPASHPDKECEPNYDNKKNFASSSLPTRSESYQYGYALPQQPRFSNSTEGPVRQNHNELSYEKIRNTKIKGFNRLVYFDGKDYTFDNDEAPPPGEKRTYILLADDALNAEKHIKPAVRRSKHIIHDTPAAYTVSNVPIVSNVPNVSKVPSVPTNIPATPECSHAPESGRNEAFSYFQFGYGCGDDPHCARSTFHPRVSGYSREGRCGSPFQYYAQFENGAGDGSCDFAYSYSGAAGLESDLGAFYTASELERNAHAIAKAGMECAQEWPPLPRPAASTDSNEDNSVDLESSHAGGHRVNSLKTIVKKKMGRKFWRSISSDIF